MSALRMGLQGALEVPSWWSRRQDKGLKMCKELPRSAGVGGEGRWRLAPCGERAEGRQQHFRKWKKVCLAGTGSFRTTCIRRKEIRIF